MFMFDQNQIRPPEACAEYEDRILDLQHGLLPGRARRGVEAHLAACPACRQFAQDLESLDVALARRFRLKELPESIKAVLLSRIDAATSGLTPELLAQRRESIEVEFRRESAGLLKRVAREHWSSLLDGLGVVALTLVTAFIMKQVLFRDLGIDALVAKAVADQATTYLLWATAAASVGVAFWFGLRGNARRFFPWA